LACYERAIQLDKNFYKSWSNKGNILDKLDRREEALECYSTAIEINPEYTYAWYNKGFTLNNLKRSEEALKCYNQAILIDGDHASAIFNKGYTLDKLGRKEEALVCLERFLVLQKDASVKRRMQALLPAAKLLVELGRFYEAGLMYDRVIDLEDGAQWAVKKRKEVLEMLEEEMRGKKKEALESLWMARKVFLVMKGVDLPPEMRWSIVMDEEGELEGTLTWNERKKAVIFGLDEARLGEKVEHFWDHLAFTPQLDYLKNNKEEEEQQDG